MKQTPRIYIFTTLIALVLVMSFNLLRASAEEFEREDDERDEDREEQVIEIPRAPAVVNMPTTSIDPVPPVVPVTTPATPLRDDNRNGIVDSFENSL